MQNRHDFDDRGPDAIDDPVQWLRELASVPGADLGHMATGLRKLLRLAKPTDDALDDLIGIQVAPSLTRTRSIHAFWSGSSRCNARRETTV